MRALRPTGVPRTPFPRTLTSRKPISRAPGLPTRLVRALLPLVVALGPAGTAVAHAQGEDPPAIPTPAVPDDDALRAAWEALPAEERIEVSRWFLAEVERLDTFQNGLLRHLFGSLEKDRYDWPAREPIAYYDAAEHCPAQPIVRRALDPDSTAARRERVRLLGREGAEADPVWVYDWARGTVVRAGDPKDPERVFAAALRGRYPDLELGEALVLQSLDPGDRREAHAAFAHGYADRTGKGVPGVTLYDAWSSGRDLEMPDVECLGVLHELTGDWRTYVAPVPESQHDALYARIADWFRPLGRQRGLREALARTYLEAEPALDSGYQANLEQLHALWERARSAPATLGPTLPDEDEKPWEAWWEELRTLLQKDRDLWGRARGRQAALRRDSARVRTLMVAILREWGALPKDG